MDNTFSYLNVVFLLGAVQGIFLAVLLFNQSRNKAANRYLAVLMLVYSAFIAESSITGTAISRQFPHLLGLAAGAIFLVGPLHYLYARSLTENGYSLSLKHLLHLIPCAGFYFYYLFPYYLKSGDFKIEYIQTLVDEGRPISLMIFNWIAVLQGIAYMTATLFLLKKYSQSIKAGYSSIDKISLNWLKHITVMTLAIWTIGFVFKLAELFGYTTQVDTLIPLLVALFVYVMGYLGLRQPEIFADVGNAKEMRKYERSGLSQEKAQAVLDRLIKLMETEKPYADSNLKLTQLAKMVSVSPNHLSQVINDTLKQNFFDFVNKYRIDEARKLLTDTAQQQFTLLSIAYEVGFNSKSAFYSAFKKHSGMTPTQYKKEHSGQ